MREIKFRGRDDEGQWHFGFLSWYSDVLACICDGADYEVDPETVGQSTGLRDANQREIYEGDIVKFTKPAYTDVPVVITWEDGAFMVDHDLYLGGRDLSRVTVIGNIYDNPELLEAKNARD